MQIVKTGFTKIKEVEFEQYNDSNELVGRAFLIIHTRPNGEKVGLVEDVWTEEKYRRQGIGSNIMAELLKEAKERGCYKVVLMCSNERLSFYERLGFKITQNAMRIDL